MLNKLLITGANGQLGAVCRKRLPPLAKTLRLNARKGLGEAKSNEVKRSGIYSYDYVNFR